MILPKRIFLSFLFIKKKNKVIEQESRLHYYSRPIQPLWIDQRHVRRRPMWQSWEPLAMLAK